MQGQIKFFSKIFPSPLIFHVLEAFPPCKGNSPIL
jgi:hypothetical protein